MITLPINAGTMERMLHEGLAVLTPEETRPLGERNFEGELIRLEENNGEALTGRAFFARGMHDLGGGYVQVTLQSYMEDVNPDTGKPERMPMMGDFANEKANLPGPLLEGMSGEWDLRVPGEKPLWAYRGVKWVGEYSLVGYVFPTESVLLMREGKPGIPRELKLKIQGQGGEYEIAYVLK